MECTAQAHRCPPAREPGTASRSTPRGSGSPTSTRPSSPRPPTGSLLDTTRAARGRASSSASPRSDRGGGIAQRRHRRRRHDRVVAASLRSDERALRRAVHRHRSLSAAGRRHARARHRHPPQRPAHRPGLGHRRRRQRDAVGSRGGDDPQRVAAERAWREPVREARGVAAVAAERSSGASAVVPYGSVRTAEGRLTDAAGKPIAGAVLDVVASVRAAGGEGQAWPGR